MIRRDPRPPALTKVRLHGGFPASGVAVLGARTKAPTSGATSLEPMRSERSQDAGGTFAYLQREPARACVHREYVYASIWHAPKDQTALWSWSKREVGARDEHGVSVLTRTEEGDTETSRAAARSWAAARSAAGEGDRRAGRRRGCGVGEHAASNRPTVISEKVRTNRDMVSSPWKWGAYCGVYQEVMLAPLAAMRGVAAAHDQIPGVDGKKCAGLVSRR